LTQVLSEVVDELELPSVLIARQVGIVLEDAMRQAKLIVLALAEEAQ
jgi:hypothetical protein